MHSILIVEDNESLGRSLQVFLRGRGLDVTHAGSIGDARAQLDAGRFDAVLLDVGLPDGSGLDLLSRTGTQRSVVMTANPDPDDFERCGVAHFVPKPFDLEDVFQTLTKIVDA